MADCQRAETNEMAVVYPKEYSKIFIPKGLDGSREKVVFEVVHRQSNQVIYWHLDHQYLGQTKNTHRLELDAAKGRHHMTLVDANGQTLSWWFELLEK